MRKKMKTSDVVVRALEQEGVRYIFGLAGEENLDLLESLRGQGKIKFVGVRHEQGAAFMADVWGRLTGKAGVCLSTLGPGATNLITGVADANLDSAPLVAITGQGAWERKHKESHQFIDIQALFKPITKWNATILSPGVAPEVVRKAFKVAQAERPGATHIELPEDVAGMDCSSKPLLRRPIVPARPNHIDLDRARELIRKAKAPMLLVGNGVIRGNASAALRKFLKANPIPVANTFMAKGAVPSSHPLSLGTIGLQLRDFVMCGFDAADLIITVGYDIVEYAPDRWNPEKEKKIIHISPLPAEVDEYYIPELEIVADIRETLVRLAKQKVVKKPWEYSSTLKKTIREEFEKHSSDPSFPVKPQRIISDLRKALGKEDLLLSDVGAHKIWIARMFPAESPNTVTISNGFASMGIALPGAIAAKLAFPRKKVLAATGDGGFLMNVQELETARRLGLDLVIVVFNDEKFALIEWKQVKEFGHAFGVDFKNPDLVQLAESFGCKGARIEKTDELLPVLKKALNGKGIWVIDVPVDYRENQKLTEQLGKNICPM